MQVPRSGHCGGFRCRYVGEVPEGSGADAEVRFRKIPVQRLGQVPDCADT